MKIAIATNSVEKIKGIKGAIERITKESVDVYNQATDSMVSDQPMDNETYDGALNRVNNLLAQVDPSNFEYLISCEAGIEVFRDLCFNIQVVCIFETSSGSYYWGKSSGWQFSKKDLEGVIENNLDAYMRGKGFNSLVKLTGDEEITRQHLVEEATIMALASKKIF